MNRLPVTSSQVKSIGYDPSSHTLEVEFHPSGESPSSVYQYSGVKPDTHSALMKAESIGSHLHKHIKGKYAFKKLS